VAGDDIGDRSGDPVALIEGQAAGGDADIAGQARVFATEAKDVGAFGEGDGVGPDAVAGQAAADRAAVVQGDGQVRAEDARTARAMGDTGLAEGASIAAGNGSAGANRQRPTGLEAHAGAAAAAAATPEDNSAVATCA